MWYVRLAGLIPRVEQIAAKSAPMIGAAAARLRSLGHQVGDKASDLISWASANKMQAALLAGTFASLGIDMAGLFESKEGEEEAKKLATGQTSLADFSRIAKAGKASEALSDLNLGNIDDRRFVQRVLDYAVTRFGSPRAALDAHHLMQSFFELPADLVEFELQSYQPGRRLT